MTWISFEFVFGIVIACVLVGWLLTFTLEESRQKTVKGNSS